MSEKGILRKATPNLPSRDLARTAAFYRDKLGFTVEGDDYEDFLMISRDDISLHFYLAREMDPLKDAGICYIYVEKVEALYREYEAAGVIHSNGKLAHRPWKMYEFVASDPDNNALRFGQPSSEVEAL
jgi:catechol 2,3-dioxygenase-like lactoylglutathione lyase family enzyme